MPSSANAEIAEISFQEGMNGYAGTVDTFVMEHEPTSSHGAVQSLEWDTDDPYGSGELKFVLIRFDSIFGSGPGQIPSGATIESAILSYTVFDAGDPPDAGEDFTIIALPDTQYYSENDPAPMPPWIGRD